MDGDTFIETITDDEYTAIERLGSDKALVAATDAALETEVVLGVVAGTERALHETASEWADGAEVDAAREYFESVATGADDRYRTLVAERDDESVPADDEFPVGAVAATDDRERVAALVGGALVDRRTLLQAVNFFVNEADRRLADTMRSVRAAAEDRAEEGASALESLCADDGDWERARETARGVVDAAYGTYVARLDAMGVDPKPIC